MSEGNTKLAETLKVSSKVVDLVLAAEESLGQVFKSFDTVSKQNQSNVLSAFKSEKIASTHFNPTTGYGYSDLGREKLSALFARVFKGEKALVSPHLLSGTHTIFLMLNALLKKDDMMLSVAGMPYDTLATAIGLTPKVTDYTLIDKGVIYEQINLNKQNQIDFDALETRLKKMQPKMVYIQRSRGYTWRSSVSISEIKTVVSLVKQHSPASIVAVDNCYGEFCETDEPLAAGADIIAGSLIKNPGGELRQMGDILWEERHWWKSSKSILRHPVLAPKWGLMQDHTCHFSKGFFWHQRL